MTEPSLAPAPPRVIEREHEVYNASLVKRVDETESLGYFWVRFDGEPTPFEPGQYMTIGVMVDGKIVQRPYSVASPPVEAGTSGYEFYVRLVQGGQFTTLLWEMPVGQKMRMIGPKGKFMLDARRRPDAHLHLVGDRQRAVRLDDEAGPRRRDASAGGVPERRLVRPRDRLSRAARGLGAVRRVPGHVHPDGLARRPIRRTPRGSAGRAASRSILEPVLRRAGPVSAANSVAYICGNPDMIIARRGDAARPRLPAGAGPQGALLAQGQGAPWPGRGATSQRRSTRPRRTRTSSAGAASSPPQALRRRRPGAGAPTRAAGACSAGPPLVRA